MHTAAAIIKNFGISTLALKQYRAEGIIGSDQLFSTEDVFKILCARCLSESGASAANIKMILSAVHPSRHLNVGIYTPHDGMLTVFFVPHANTAQRRYALDQIWKIQSKSRVAVVINFEKIIDDIEAALGVLVFKDEREKA